MRARTPASRTFATTTSVTSSAIWGTAVGTVPGSMSVPTATKNSTANTSRNGSRRRRASAVSARLLIARPATNAARAVGTPKNTAPAPANASPDATEMIRNRSCSERSRLRTNGSTWAATTARTANATSSASATGSDRPSIPEAAMMIVPRATPVTS